MQITLLSFIIIIKSILQTNKIGRTIFSQLVVISQKVVKKKSFQERDSNSTKLIKHLIKLSTAWLYTEWFPWRALEMTYQTQWMIIIIIIRLPVATCRSAIQKCKVTGRMRVTVPQPLLHFCSAWVQQLALTSQLNNCHKVQT